ncbi:MAG: hypothetical protein J0L55_10900, partial [Caulobacterales bacterium]|nr:hypothetical protein [Caulobacterales bacterium]
AHGAADPFEIFGAAEVVAGGAEFGQEGAGVARDLEPGDALGYFAFMASSRALVTESVDTEARATAIAGTEIFSSLAAFVGMQIVGEFAANFIKTNQALIYLSPLLILSVIALAMAKETNGTKIDDLVA